MKHGTVPRDIRGKRLKDHIAPIEMSKGGLSLSLTPKYSLLVKAQTFTYTRALGLEFSDVRIECLDASTELIGHLTDIECGYQPVDLIELEAQIAQHADKPHEGNLRRRVEAVSAVVDDSRLEQPDLVVIDKCLPRDVEQARHLADGIHTLLHGTSQQKARRPQGRRAHTAHFITL